LNEELDRCLACDGRVADQWVVAVDQSLSVDLDFDLIAKVARREGLTSKDLTAEG